MSRGTHARPPPPPAPSRAPSPLRAPPPPRRRRPRPDRWAPSPGRRAAGPARSRFVGGGSGRSARPAAARLVTLQPPARRFRTGRKSLPGRGDGVGGGGGGWAGAGGPRLPPVGPARSPLPRASPAERPAVPPETRGRVPSHCPVGPGLRAPSRGRLPGAAVTHVILVDPFWSNSWYPGALCLVEQADIKQLILQVFVVYPESTEQGHHTRSLVIYKDNSGRHCHCHNKNNQYIEERASGEH